MFQKYQKFTLLLLFVGKYQKCVIFFFDILYVLPLHYVGYGRFCATP